MTDDALIKRIAKAYSTALAIRIVQGQDGPFARVIENVEIDHGECRRKLTLDWHLPTLAEALPDYPEVTKADFIAHFHEANPVLVVPIHVMRIGRLMTEFGVEDQKGEQLYVCGRAEWTERAKWLLKVFWTFVDIAPNGLSTEQRARIERAKSQYLSLPMEDVSAAPKIAKKAVRRLREASESGLVLHPGALERIEVFGRYIATRHLTWVHLTRRPGQTVRLTISYRTRFAAEYSPTPSKGSPLRGRRFLHRAIEWVRRAVGQEPFMFRVPLSMHSYCRSYHFTMPSPTGTYFKEQRFVLQDTLRMSQKSQEKAFNKFCEEKGAYALGNEEAGGPIAHLYGRNLRQKKFGDQLLYAYAYVRERPPGTTAAAMWLCLFSASFLWLFYGNWDRLVGPSSTGVNVTTLFVALPGFASIWFAKAFQAEIRSRIPLVNRLGLLLVGLSTFYTLVSSMVARRTGTPEAGWASTLSDGFSQTGVAIFTVFLSIMSLVLIWRRITFHSCYQRLQNSVVKRYMS
ncbi:hypothetical protein [Amycolatopsis sp. CB00013]|uniref:hypothetical protein n=1 Tax=Amycolatopsis sp. CB00013 TaxID=1703945 RepID=UPI00093E914F|nr:hypothetical protein [Amycolatopsis sp. CB00013]OKJ98354.1 hypothetical protein AMK34_15820 [Amycolatopsis sp. CB00013]